MTCHLLLVILQLIAAGAVTGQRITVSASGKADFKTIQSAINSLTDSSDIPRTIYVKNGLYQEKIYIEKHNVIIEGEDRAKTIITASIARDQWRCLHNDDWGVATLNIDGNDITLKNITVRNNYGFEDRKPVTIFCNTDTVNRQKTISKNSHQMAVRTMNATRLIAINCHFVAFGGDTVSPWNVDRGLFYFKDCVMEGGVDFYCPRGWAFAENCKFISHSGTAAIWHDGSRHQDSKTVLKNCSFEGFDGFNLGRFHRDGQFYLINCRFPANMADRDIYMVPTTNKLLWGRRVYYFNCHRAGGDYAWHADNLSSASGNPDPLKINADWVFGNNWHPQTKTN
ncbi:MAG: pectinesterase [Gemmatimonadaceae bacterium]|nr:pectinesterase [Chitinophagaceae bacterium]